MTSKNMVPELIEFNVKGKRELMHRDHFTRWACLLEAMDVISEKCDAMKLSRDDTSWIKPNAIGKYINDRFPSMHHSIARELQCRI